jgi:glucose 1-dehydrogenase
MPARRRFAPPPTVFGPVVSSSRKDPIPVSAGIVQGIAVVPGIPHSAHLHSISLPPVGPGDVRVRTLVGGVCGTDREIVEAKFGAPPFGESALIIGHEVVGIVEEIGSGVVGFAPGDLVTATVRRGCGCGPCASGQPDFCETLTYNERGILRMHGYWCEQWVEAAANLVLVPASVGELGVLLEPMTIAEKALRQAAAIQRRIAGWRPRTALVYGGGPIGVLTALVLRARDIDVVVFDLKDADAPNAALVQAAGARWVSLAGTTPQAAARDLPPLDLIVECTGRAEPVFASMEILANNGVLAAISITGMGGDATIPADAINLGFVLGNKVLVGCVNAHRDDFDAALIDLQTIDGRWPGLIARTITHRYPALDPATLPHLTHPAPGGIKAVLDFGGPR